MLDETDQSIHKFVLIRPCGSVTAAETAIALKNKIVICPLAGDPHTLTPHDVRVTYGGDTKGVILDDETACDRFSGEFVTAVLRDDTLTFYE